MEDTDNKYLDYEGLEYFLEKFKYAMAHNNTEESKKEGTSDN